VPILDDLIRRLFARPYLLLVLATLMWGGNAVAGRLAVGEVSPMVVVTLRWGLVCIIFLTASRRGIAADWPAVKPHLLQVFLLGACGFTIFNALFYAAAHETTAVNMTILQGAMPAIVLMGSFAFFRARIGPLQIAGVAITLLGVATLASGGDPHALLALRINHGDLMMLFANLFYAGYIIALRRRPAASPLGLFAYIAIASFVSALPLLAYEMLAGRAVLPHSAFGWGLMVFIAVLPSLVGQVFFIRAIELIGPGRAGIFMNLVPVFGALLGVLVLGEPFGWHHALALSLVVTGILLAERRAAGLG